MRISTRIRRHPVHVVPLVAALLLLSGCSAGGGNDTGAAASASPSHAPYSVASLLHPDGMMLGVSSDGEPGRLAPVTAFTASAGRAPDLREYYTNWGEDFDPAGNAALWADGQLPLLTWTPNGTTPARIAAGADDAYLTRFAGQVRSYDGPVAISFAPEMNGDWNAWGPGHATAADYVRAWRHIHDLFQSQQATNVIWVWTPHATDSGTPAAIGPYFPGAKYIDWVGLIGYYGPGEGSDYRTLFAPTEKVLRGLTGKPLLIAETGVAEGPRKPAQIRDLFTGVSGSKGVIGLVWFDSRKQWPGSSTPTDWRVASSVAAAEAFRAAVAGHRVWVAR